MYYTSSHAKHVIFLNQYTPTISLVPIDNNNRALILQKKGSDIV